MTDFELTRRDAIAALATAGVTVTAVGDLTWDDLDETTSDADGTFTEHHREMLDAVAGVVYPSQVSGVAAFVERYVVGRVREDPERLSGMVDALDYLDSYSRRWYDDAFLALSPDERETVMRAMGAHLVDPDPNGTDVHRFRFYVVNELLYALYSSPTGGELVGLENPQGYPGGTESYQQPPGGDDGE